MRRSESVASRKKIERRIKPVSGGGKYFVVVFCMMGSVLGEKRAIVGMNYDNNKSILLRVMNQ